MFFHKIQATSVYSASIWVLNPTSLQVKEVERIGEQMRGLFQPEKSEKASLRRYLCRGHPGLDELKK